MESEWKEVTLSDLGEVSRGRSRHRPRYAEHLYGGAYPFIQTGDVKASNGRLNSHSQTYSEDGLKQSRLWPAKTMCITIAANIAETGILSYPACFPDSIIGFIADDKKCDVYFIEYMFRFLRRKLQHEATGSVQDNINLQTIERLKFLIPPLNEQKSIAHILGSLDDKIELNRQMNATLEAMAQALFKSWFVDFDPVLDNALATGQTIPDELQAKAQARLALGAARKPLPPEIQSLFPNRFVLHEEMGWIPEGWEVESLPKVIDFLEGPGIRNWQYTEAEDGIKFINIRCIQNGDLKLDTANKITREEAFGKYMHFQLQEDDIVISTSGTLGRFAFVRKNHLPLSLNTSVIRFQPIRNVSTLHYIAGYTATDLQWELEKRASGSVQRNFGPMHLKQIKMLLPPYSILENHNTYANDLFRKRKTNLNDINILEQLRDTLLPKLLSGELPIPEAEKLASEVD